MSKLPIAETFRSIQGEGVWTGTPMLFIRLAGCNVGKYDNPPELHLGNARVFNRQHSICTTVQGERFLCDTDYHKMTEKTPQELLGLVGNLKHVCITGGEPFLHDFEELQQLLGEHHIELHVETSGTKPIPKWAWWHWITCSPKEGFDYELLNNDLVDEWKYLVGENFKEEEAVLFAASDTEPDRPFFLQPIGDIHLHLKKNITKCLDVLKRHPEWRLSFQAHKYLELR